MSYIKSIQKLLTEQYSDMVHYEKVQDLTHSLQQYHYLEDIENSTQYQKDMPKEHIAGLKNHLLEKVAQHHQELVSYQKEHVNHPGYNGHILHEPLLDMLKTSKEAHDNITDTYHEKYHEEIGV